MSIYKRDKSYRVVVLSGKNQNGRPRRISRTASSLAEAKNLEAGLILSGKGKGHYEATVSSLCLSFLESCHADRRTTTILFYEKILRLHVIPYLGDIKINKLNVSDIEAWKNQIDRKTDPRTGKSFSLVYKRYIFKTLKQAIKHFNTIYDTSYFVMERVKTFQADPDAVTEEKKINVWTQSDFESVSDWILKKADSFSRTDPSFLKWHAAYILLNICFYAGTRKGEANALTVSDFHDSAFPFLHICKSVTLQIPKKSYLVTNAKASHSNRDIPIPSILSDRIKTHINTVISSIPHFDGSMFLCSGIRPLYNTTLCNIKNMAEKETKTPHIRIHDLRDSYVSFLINSGVDPVVVRDLVGHYSVDLTLNTYTKIYKSNEEKAVSIFDKK